MAVVSYLGGGANFRNPIVTAARLTPSRLATSALDRPLFTNAAQRSQGTGPDSLLRRPPTAS